MKSRQARVRSMDVKPQLTPMVDIVFLLLIFFVIAFRPTQLLSEVSVGTVPQSVVRDVVTPSPMLIVTVTEDGYRATDRRMTYLQVARLLRTVAGHSAEFPVRVSSEVDAAHSGLVRLLDLCESNKLANVTLSLR